MSTRTTYTILAALVIALLAGAAQAETININWRRSDKADYVGEGILTLGDTEGVWNNITTTMSNPVSTSGSNLLDSEGNPTSVGFSQTNARFLYAMGGLGADLCDGGLVNFTKSVVVSGLTPGDYKVAAMGVYNSNLATMDIDGGASQTTGPFTTVSNTDPSYWAVFDITVDSSGSFTLANYYTGGEPTLNAMQIQAVPEPASMALMGMGGLALLRRRRRI